jgi:eukaryotic-like serine/threonine-protein kinase
VTRQVIQRDKLGALTKIGQGGQGVVYGAPNVKTKFAAAMVFKEYKTQVLGDIDFTALAAMPALVEESLSYAEAERLIAIAAWPCALVENAGTPQGFVMPAIPDQFFIPFTTVKGVTNATAEFQHLLNHPSVLAARGINIDDAQRYSLLREVASGLASLHKHGVCVGDISPKNLLFSLTPAAAAYFIDCDAMRINGVSVLRQVETPGWQVPAGEELATVYSDAYKLGLLALRLLAGDHDTTNLQHIPATAPDMLRQVITDTLTNPPQQRPLPEAWTYVLGHAIEYAQYQQKTAAPTPLSVAPDAPSVPVLHSRPSSVPPSRPSAPPVWSQPPSAPPSPPGVGGRPYVAASAPTAAAPRSSNTPLLIGAGLAVIAIIAIAVSVVVITSRNNSGSSSATAPSSSTAAAYPSDSDSTPYSTPYSSAMPTPTTPTVSIPPPGLYRDADPSHASCPDGFQVNGGSGWATHAGRGSETTSCVFTRNVLVAYWNGPPPSRDTRQVNAPGSINCPDVASNCAGNDFIMSCSVNGNDTWITCIGGNDAVVYLW